MLVFRRAVIGVLSGAVVLVCHAAAPAAASASALTSASDAQRVAAEDKTVGTISPVFDQLLYFQMPTAFTTVYEKAREADYIREAVLQGESADNWTQMVTVTGRKNLAADHPDETPRQFGQAIVDGYRQACPTTLAVRKLQEGPLYGNDTLVMVVSCGLVSAPAGSGGRSETAAIAVVKGAKDFYTLQWAERGGPSNKPLPIDAKRWAARMKRLMPLKLCAIVPGEAPPYPSCVGG